MYIFYVYHKNVIVFLSARNYRLTVVVRFFIVVVVFADDGGGGGEQVTTGACNLRAQQ